MANYSCCQHSIDDLLIEYDDQVSAVKNNNLMLLPRKNVFIYSENHIRCVTIITISHNQDKKGELTVSGIILQSELAH